MGGVHSFPHCSRHASGCRGQGQPTAGPASRHTYWKRALSRHCPTPCQDISCTRWGGSACKSLWANVHNTADVDFIVWFWATWDSVTCLRIDCRLVGRGLQHVETLVQCMHGCKRCSCIVQMLTLPTATPGDCTILLYSWQHIA